MDLHRRLSACEDKLNHIEIKRAISKIKSDLFKKNVLNSEFCIVPNDYYERTLEDRAIILQAHTIDQLCKTIVFENMNFKLSNNLPGIDSDCNDASNPRYICVIVQYSAKIDTELLVQALICLRKPGEHRLSKSNFNFQLAPETVSDALTGFIHNGVTPYALKTSLPILICQRCLQVSPPLIWMGGGHPQVKLRVSASDFLRSTGALSYLVSNPR